MTIALYAGSFDPITLGHLDIIQQGSKIFEKVLIGVAFNPDKKGFLPVDKKVELIKECTKQFSNIEVYSFDGLTVDFAKKHNAAVLLRGIRNSADFEYENQLAQINSKINPNIKTVFLTSNPENNFISSSAVRELVSHKQPLTAFVPKPVEEYLRKNLY